MEEVAVQASRVIAKFGSPYRLERALENALPQQPEFWRSAATIYRWTYSRARGGTGGLIPHSMIQPIMRAARAWGIFLDDSDFALKMRDKKLTANQVEKANRKHIGKYVRRVAGQEDEEKKPFEFGTQFEHRDEQVYEDMLDEQIKKDNELEVDE